MPTRLSPKRLAGLALGCGLPLLAGGSAVALQIDDGDVVGIFVKNGFELVVNLGPFEAGTIDLSGKFSGPQFEGSPADAKFVALAVEDPGRTVNVPGFGVVPQENIIYSTLTPDPLPTDIEIEQSMKSVDVEKPGATTWFNLLRSLPGSDSEVIDSAANFSYETVLGLGTDAIGNNVTFSTAGQVDGQGRLTIPIYSDARGYEDFGGPATLYLTLGEIQIDDTEVTFAVPEAAALLQSAAGVVVWLAFGAVRRRRSALG